MATCVVSGVIKDPTDTAVSSATIEARVLTPYFNTTIQVVPKTVSTTTDTNGAWSLTLIQGATVQITINYPPNTIDSAKTYTYMVTVPASGTANFSSLATEL